MMGQGVTVQGWKVRICPTTEPPKTWGFFCLSGRVWAHHAHAGPRVRIASSRMNTMTTRCARPQLRVPTPHPNAPRPQSPPIPLHPPTQESQD